MVMNALITDIGNENLKISNTSTNLESMIPYTERHFHRMTQLLQDLHFISYTVNCMKPHVTNMSTDWLNKFLYNKNWYSFISTFNWIQSTNSFGTCVGVFARDLGGSGVTRFGRNPASKKHQFEPIHSTSWENFLIFFFFGFFFIQYSMIMIILSLLFYMKLNLVYVSASTNAWVNT